MATTVPYWNSRKTDGVTMGFQSSETSSPVCKFNTETDCAYLITAEVVAVKHDDYTLAGSWIRTVGVLNDGGTASILNSTVTSVHAQSTLSGSDAVTFAISGTELHVTFTTGSTDKLWIRTRLNVLKLGKPAPHQWGASADEYYGAS